MSFEDPNKPFGDLQGRKVEGPQAETPVDWRSVIKESDVLAEEASRAESGSSPIQNLLGRIYGMGEGAFITDEYENQISQKTLLDNIQNTYLQIMAKAFGGDLPLMYDADRLTKEAQKLPEIHGIRSEFIEAATAELKQHGAFLTVENPSDQQAA